MWPAGQNDVVSYNIQTQLRLWGDASAGGVHSDVEVAGVDDSDVQDWLDIKDCNNRNN